jgi:hypothetical protein
MVAKLAQGRPKSLDAEHVSLAIGRRYIADAGNFWSLLCLSGEGYREKYDSKGKEENARSD